MKRTRRLLAFFLLGTAFSFPLAAAAADKAEAKPRTKPPESVASLINAEQSFVATARDEGTRQAFLKVLDKDAFLFRPGPVRGRQWMTRWSGNAGVLSWTPLYIEVSRSGDFGYTTGPWEYRGNADSERPTETGFYLSVWRKNSEGDWRLLTELGTVSDVPDSAHVGDWGWKVTAGDPGTALTPAERQDELDRVMDLDRALSDSAYAHGWDGLLPSLADDARFAGMGKAPVVGKKTVYRTLKETFLAPAWEPQSGAVAGSDDLACTFGRTYPPEYAEGKSVQPDGSYVRVWRKNPEGYWTVAAIAQIPFSRH